MPDSFDNTQQAVETITGQYDALRAQDVGHREAIDFIVLEHGLTHKRAKVVALVNDHLAGIAGQSGEQTTAVVSTPSTPLSPAAQHKPAHGGYPGTVDPGTVSVPDTFPEDWSA